MSSSCSPLEFSDLQSSKTAPLFLPSSFCSKVTLSGRPPLTTPWRTATLPPATQHSIPLLLGPIFCYMSNHSAHWMFSWLFSVSRHKNVSSMRAGTSCYSATSPGAGVGKEFSKYSLNIHGMKVRAKGRMPLSSYCPTGS